MRSIIRGKRYDTDKATLIGETAAPGYVSVTDFHYWEAGLYVTKGGRYFLAGEGGPMTRWARNVGSERTGGAGIVPLDKDEALEWAERYLTTAEVEKEFGAVVENA